MQKKEGKSGNQEPITHQESAPIEKNSILIDEGKKPHKKTWIIYLILCSWLRGNGQKGWCKATIIMKEREGSEKEKKRE